MAQSLAFLRLYPFSDIYNFRDFGAYPTLCGSQIKGHKLFRSANFSRASLHDLNTLADLNINLRVDLRHPSERTRQPNRWPAEPLPLTELLFTSPPEQTDPDNDYAPHEAFMSEHLNTTESAHTYMLTAYKARPHETAFITIFSNTLKHMARTGDTIVIHCAAGKDRTGTLAAIIQSTLGVHPDDVMADYMLTMAAVNIDSFLVPAAKMMQKRYGRPYDPETLRPMFGVDPEYLQASLESIGNMQHYLSETLQITPDECERIKYHYLA